MNLCAHLNVIPVHVNNSKPMSFLINHRCIIMPRHQVMSNVTADRALQKKDSRNYKECKKHVSLDDKENTASKVSHQDNLVTIWKS